MDTLLPAQQARSKTCNIFAVFLKKVIFQFWLFNYVYLIILFFYFKSRFK